MGKRYYCDFCDKTMVATPSVIKTHNKGVGHQKMVSEHYRQFKDPETILMEESKKTPCLRFPTGKCPFGSICRFSHYKQEEMDELRRYVAEKHNNESNINQPSFEDLYHKLQDQKSKQSSDTENIVLYDKNGVTHVFPWTYNPVFDSYGENLPQSIKRLKIEDFVNAEMLLVKNGNCDNKYYNTNKLLKLLETIINSSDKDVDDKLKLIFVNSDSVNNKISAGFKDKKNYGGEYMDAYDAIKKQILRYDPDKKEKSKTGKLLRYQHKRKMDELIDFMRDHYASTNYFYSEMQRIKRQYSVKDAMREMIDYLEEPLNYEVKEKILKVFHKLKKKKIEEVTLWNPPTNTLVINTLKDPFNDGVIR